MLGQAVNVDICLANGRLVAVEIVGRNPRADIALVKAPIRYSMPQTALLPALGGRVCAGSNQFGLGLSVKGDANKQNNTITKSAVHVYI